MKKIFCLLLSICLICAVTGCKGKDKDISKVSSTSMNVSKASSKTAEKESEPQSSNNSSETVSSEEKKEHVSSVTSETDTPQNPQENQSPPNPTEIPESGVPFISAEYTDEQLMNLDKTKNGYGHGVHKDADNRPTGATGAQERYGKYGAVFIAPKSQYVFLTFDLGYENGYTPKILDTLAEKNAKGIFFVTMEYCKSAPDIVKRIIDEGHVLGNHSVHHKSMPTLSIDEMRSEITGMHDYIKEKYGYEMFLFRPPMGEYSERSLAVAQSLGYQTMNWSFAYKDWDTANQPDPTYAKNKMINDAHGGAVYLIHAVSKTNAAVLGSVIDGIRQKGYVTAKYVKS